MMRHTPGPRDGFTLMELLISIAILTAITLIVYSSFVSVTDTMALARDNADLLRFRQYIARSFTENMTAIYADAGSQQADYGLIGEDESGPFGDGDSIEFCTSLPMPGGDSLPGVLKRVRYELVDPGYDEEGTGELAIDATGIAEPESMDLLITEEPLVLESEDFGGDDTDNTLEDEGAVRERRIPVRSMNITYYDFEEEEWVDDWDSVEDQRMPWAIRVQINLVKTDAQLEIEYDQGINPEEEPDLDLTFAVPTGAGVVSPFTDFNHYNPSRGGLDGDNIFEENG